MSAFQNVRPIVVIAVLALGLVFPALAPAPTASANGAATEVVRQRVGPYEIAVGTIPATPTVGVVHLTVTVLEAASSLPVVDAVVRVTSRGPEDTQPETFVASSFAIAPVFYDTSVPVPAPGTWWFTVQVFSPRLGEASLEFPLEVREGGTSLAVIVLAIAMAPLLAAIAWVLRSRALRRRRNAG